MREKVDYIPIAALITTRMTPALKDKSKVRGDFLIRFPLKLAENDDVGETVI